MFSRVFDTFRNIFKLEETRKRVLFTIFILFIYRVGANIALVPGVKSDALSSLADAAGPLNIIGNFSKLSIFSMGVMPYITASIIMQLVAIVVPKIERMLKEDVDGRKKYNKITKFLAVFLGIFQAIALTRGFSSAFVDMPMAMYALVILSMTTGTLIMIWFGEKITEKGLGNGISLLIFINIISRLPQGLQALYSYAINGKLVPILGIVAFAVPVIMIIVLMQGAERRILVQYSKRSGVTATAHKSHIPLKLNMAGVMPVIFAMSLMQLPAVISKVVVNLSLGSETTIAFWEKIAIYSRYDKNGWAALAYTLLIMFFAYFFVSVQGINPVQVAENIKKSAGFIPGVRPGKETVDYLRKVVNTITFVGAIFLAAIALLPAITGVLSGIDGLGFGGTSLLIAVGVALDTMRQLEAKMITRNYKGFLN